MLPQDMQNPAVVSAVVAGIVALLTKLVDNIISRRKMREKFRLTDRELLSKDEQEFRLTIIKQLQQCNDAQSELRRLNSELVAQEVKLSTRIAHLEYTISWLEDVLRANNLPLPFKKETNEPNPRSA